MATPINVIPTDRRFLSRSEATEEQLGIVGLPPKYSQYIRVMDQDTDGLTLLHYLTATVGDEREIDTKRMDKVGDIRGVILDLKRNTIVCRSLPYTPEIDSSDMVQLEKYFSGDLSAWKFYHACEGTVIRVYWTGTQWAKSTHRKLDAHSSYWSGPSFGELFDQVSKFELGVLNKDWCYAFLLSHRDNRLVYEIPDEGQLMLISVYDRKNNIFIKPESWGDSLEGVVIQPHIKEISKLADLVEMCKEGAKEKRFDRAGIIAFKDEEHPMPIKVLASDYNNIRNVRGNDPNIGIRYILLRGTEKGKLLQSWYSDAESISAFEDAECEIDNLIEDLHGLYIARYVHKVIETLPKEEFVVIRKCHEWHTQNRRKNIVTQNKVREVLSDTAGHYILIMLKRQRSSRAE